MPAYAIYELTTGEVIKHIRIDEGNESIVILNTPTGCGFKIIPPDINANTTKIIDNEFVSI